MHAWVRLCTSLYLCMCAVLITSSCHVYTLFASIRLCVFICAHSRANFSCLSLFFFIHLFFVLRIFACVYLPALLVPTSVLQHSFLISLSLSLYFILFTSPVPPHFPFFVSSRGMSPIKRARFRYLNKTSQH